VTDIPKVSPIVVDAISDMLLSDQGMRRPPDKAAHMLAVICALHKKDQPFPRREEMAEAINASISTVDAALSTRLSEGYLSIEMDTEQGNVARRNGVVRHKYYIPSPQLLEVYEQAERRLKKAKS